MSTIKSGWLDKYSGTIFKSWKKRYVVLYRDGEFSVYDNPNQATADTRIRLKAECKKVTVGFACGAMNLPKGQSNVDSLFCIETRGGKEYYFAAASDRDCSEWVAVIQQARSEGYPSNVVPQAPHAAPMVYQHHIQGGPPPPYTMGQPPPPPQGYPAPYPQPQVVYQPAPGYGQPMYGPRPMYGQQPVYVQSVPQQHQSSNNSSRNMLLGAAAGGLGGFMLGSMVSNSMHHGGWGHDSFDHGGWDHHDSFDHGGFDGGCDGGFDF